jgi:alkylation response protein AidB-like acyl-CoA dehydrogenase
MIDFSLTDEQKALRELGHDFAEKEIRPVASEYDRDMSVRTPATPARKRAQHSTLERRRSDSRYLLMRMGFGVAPTRLAPLGVRS